jgi:hypothetical protein
LSCKLAQQINSLYKALKQIRHSFKLKLLKSIKVYLVFYTKKLCKDFKNPFLKQTNPEPLLLKVKDSKAEYKMQKVLVVKLIRGKLKYYMQ